MQYIADLRIQPADHATRDQAFLGYITG